MPRSRFLDHNLPPSTPHPKVFLISITLLSSFLLRNSLFSLGPKPFIGLNCCVLTANQALGTRHKEGHGSEQAAAEPVWELGGAVTSWGRSRCKSSPQEAWGWGWLEGQEMCCRAQQGLLRQCRFPSWPLHLAAAPPTAKQPKMFSLQKP